MMLRSSIRARAHTGRVTALASIPSLGQFASIGDDQVLRLWDAKTGLRIDTKELYLAEPAHGMQFDRETNRLLVAFQGGVGLFELGPDGVVYKGTATCSHDVRFYCCIDADRILVSGMRSSSILNANTGRPLYSLGTQEADVRLVSAEKDKLWFVLADGTYRLFELMK